MRNFFVFLIISFISTTAWGADWVKLEPGLLYRSFSPDLPDNVTGKGAYIHAFRINPSKYNIEPIYMPGRRLTASRMVESFGALIAINANFFDTDGKALGLIIKNGRKLSEFKNISWWGLLRIESDWVSILHSSDYSLKEHYHNMLQAGPRLIINKTIPKLKEGTSQRTAVGITKKGELILLSVLKPITLKDLAKIMILPEKNGGLECVQALNLDGGSSTQMAAHINDFDLQLPSYLSVPVGLGVFRR